MRIVTGRPVEPHAPLPASLVSAGGDGFEPFLWAPLLPQMLELLGLQSEALEFEYASRTFPEARSETGSQPLECPHPAASFLPSEHGFVVVLGDGTESGSDLSRTGAGELGRLVCMCHLRDRLRGVRV